MKPTKAEIKKFLEVFDVLAYFEGQQRYIRGMGVFTEADLEAVRPICVKVTDWLSEEVLRGE